MRYQSGGDPKLKDKSLQGPFDGKPRAAYRRSRFSPHWLGGSDTRRGMPQAAHGMELRRDGAPAGRACRGHSCAAGGAAAYGGRAGHRCSHRLTVRSSATRTSHAHGTHARHTCTAHTHGTRARHTRTAHAHSTHARHTRTAHTHVATPSLTPWAHVQRRGSREGGRRRHGRASGAAAACCRRSCHGSRRPPSPQSRRNVSAYGARNRPLTQPVRLPRHKQVRDTRGNTLLSLAAWHGHIEVRRRTPAPVVAPR